MNDKEKLDEAVHALLGEKCTAGLDDFLKLIKEPGKKFGGLLMAAECSKCGKFAAVLVPPFRAELMKEDPSYRIELKANKNSPASCPRCRKPNPDMVISAATAVVVLDDHPGVWKVPAKVLLTTKKEETKNGL